MGKNTRSREHSQGFFEPSLPSHANNSVLSASAIAAQAAMHFQNPKGHDRRRSKTDIEQPSRPSAPRKPSFPTPIQTNVSSSASSNAQSRTNSAGPRTESTAAASAAFPRSPMTTPPPSQQSFDSYIQSPANEKDSKASKDRPKKKLFSRPNKIHISKDKDVDKKAIHTAGPYGSANRSVYNGSTTSLADPLPPPSLYSLPNASASTSTLVPSERSVAGEKEKHKHNFLTRQKNRLKDDHHAIALSSASSNSRPVDPSAPQSLYSFAPSSPGIGSKSISGFDIRHAGRAFREKKTQEKSSVPTFTTPRPGTASGFESGRAALGPLPESNSVSVPPSNTSAYGNAAELGIPNQGLSGFGLQNMSADDAWPLLKARLLNIFEGEDLRTPVEDFNRLVGVHLQRCIDRRSPINILEDLRELLYTGFTSLDQTLRPFSDEQLVPTLVETWTFVFSTVLPFMQAALLPLDLEFKGHGTLLPPQEAKDFWAQVTQSSAAEAKTFPNLDVRTLVLLHYRDLIILPRHETLLHIFSRLSLDSLNSAAVVPPFQDTAHPQARPGTASSSAASTAAGLGLTGLGSNVDPSSFNSQGSTLLDSAAGSSLDGRSRATSNTSAGSFHSMPSRGRAGTNPAAPVSANNPAAGAQAATPVMDSAKVTETAARMLQCFSVLSRLRGTAKMLVVAGTGAAEREREQDEAEVTARKMERLARELKLNWLGRSRMGRDRRGLVGSKAKPVVGFGTPRLGGGAAAEGERFVAGVRGHSRMGSEVSVGAIGVAS